MRQAFISHTLNFIMQNQQDITDEQIEKLKYGLECLYITITKFVVLFSLALVLGILKDFIFILLFFNILRYPAFGFHAGNSFMCFVLSSLLFIGLPYILLHVEISPTILYILLFFSLGCFIIFAPADTEKRPLSNKKRRRIRKIVACILAFLYILFIIFFPNVWISKYLFIALLLETIAIVPPTYWIFGQHYANYRKLNQV